MMPVHPMDYYILQKITEEYRRREQLLIEALWSCAFFNELEAVCDAGVPWSWRLW